MTSRDPPTASDPSVHPIVARLGAYSWRLIAIGIVAWVVLGLLDRLRIVAFPILVATLLTVALSGPAHWLRQRGWPSLLATWSVLLCFIGTLTLAGLVVVPAFAGEFRALGDAVGEAYDDLVTWTVEDSPLDVDRRRLDELEEQARDAIGRSLSSSSGVLVRSAVLVLEVATGTVLALVLTFFFVKDGERFQQAALQRLAPHQRARVSRMAQRAWETLGGYLRGSALLGIVEAVVIGSALWLTGGGLVAPVMVITFLAAFVPFVGAVAAGVIAVAVALVTSGTTAALIVGGVALAVQQLDNDLLAPVVFGRTLELHPVVILLAVTSGGALAGLAGAFLAVPLTAVVINVLAEANEDVDGN